MSIMGDYWQELQAVTAMQAFIKGGNRPVLYGDSITYYLGGAWPDLAGAPFNVAAFPGARLQDLIDNLTVWNNAVLRDVAPSCGIILIGTNDALAGDTGTSPSFLDALGVLIPAIRSFLPDPTKLAIATIPPMELGRTVDATAMLPFIQDLNAIIRQGAAAEKMPLLDVYGAMALASGYAPSGSTVDGVHFYASAAGPIKALYDAQITAWGG